jgi:hypothetical protein
MMGNVENVLLTEWSRGFEADVMPTTKGGGQGSAQKRLKFMRLCKDAMVMSYHKYGRVADGCGPGKASIPLESIERRLELYERGGEVKGTEHRGGNTEWLTDVYNFAMMESMHPRGGLEMKPRLPSPVTLNRCAAIRQQLEKFEQDRNYWRLVSIGKLALAEFVAPIHPGAYFKGTDGSPGRMTVEGESERPNLVGSARNFR